MADLNKIIEDLSSLTVVEAAELSKQLEVNGVYQQQLQLQQHQQQQPELHQLKKKTSLQLY